MSRRRERRAAYGRQSTTEPRSRRRPHEPPEEKPRSTFQRQMISVYILSGLLVALLLLYANGPEVYDLVASRFGTGIPMSVLDDAMRRSVIEPLDARDLRQMGRQREKVAQLGRRYGGRVPSGSIRDLELLQEILNRRGVEPDDRWALQALGITLGDVLAQQFALDWVVVNDDYGRSRALQIGDEEDVIFPVTMISKRVEAGHTVYIEDLYQRAADTVRDVKQRRGI